MYTANSLVAFYGLFVIVAHIFIYFDRGEITGQPWYVFLWFFTLLFLYIFLIGYVTVNNIFSHSCPRHTLFYIEVNQFRSKVISGMFRGQQRQSKIFMLHNHVSCLKKNNFSLITVKPKEKCIHLFAHT